MRESSGTKAELIAEISALRQKIQKLEKAEAKRKRAEKELRASEENFRRSLDESPLGVRIVTADGETLYANQAILDFYGYDSFKELKTTPVERRYTKESCAEFKIRSEKRKQGVDVSSEYTIDIIRKNGEVRHLQVYRKEILWNGERQYQVVYQDINERKQAEEALHKFNKLFHGNPALMALSSLPERRFIDINNAFLNTLGYSREEVIDKTSMELGIFSQPEKQQKLADELKESGRIANHDLKIKSKNGTIIDGLFSGEIIESHGKKYFLTVMIDQTDRKKAEEAMKASLAALQTSEAQYRLLSEHMTDAIWLMDMNLNITYHSPTVEMLRGFTEQEIMEMPWEKHVTPESLKLAAEVFSEEIPKVEADPGYNPVRTLELEYYCKDGTILPTESKFSIIRDESGRPASILGEARDIRERRQAEKMLLDIIEKNPMSIQIVDKEGFTLKVNPAHTLLFGSIPPSDFSLFADLQNKYPEIDKFILLAKSGEVVHLPDLYYNANDVSSEFPDVPLWIRATIFSLKDNHGKPERFVFMHENITARRQAEAEKHLLEERLRHADKMEAIGTLAGGIAHDFNNLLMGIQGYASMALMNIDPANPNYERLKHIEQQVQSGADLTSQLLGFARGGRYEVKPTDMNEILEKTSSMFGRTKKEIAIHRKHGKNIWSVEADRGQMEQVFLNLYVNAWQAMSGGGEIYLETDNVLLNVEQALLFSLKTGKYVKIKITDTGMGMDDTTQERIFDPFFTTKGMGRGTGLGLATVYGIIKGHQGMILVESVPDQGTTFTIYLPASGKKVVQEKTLTGEISRGKETILLVDDEKMVLEVNNDLLASMGYKVYAVGSGQEALDVFLEKRNEIDLIILDMIMPGISGSDTFDRLREINPTIKVLLLSGYSLSGKAQAIMDRGCNGFLQKPFHLEQLSGKVREILEI